MSFINNLAKKAQAAGRTASRVYDQANVFDNGLSYQTRQVAPNVAQRSVLQQAVPIAQGFVRAPAQFVNTAVNTVPMADYTIRQNLAAHTNNPLAYQNATRNLNAAMGNFQNRGGLANVGTFIDAPTIRHGSAATIAKKTFGNTLATEATIAPVGKIGAAFTKAGTPLYKAIPTLAAQGGVAGGTFSAGQQLQDNGRISAKQLARDAAIGATLGGGLPLAGRVAGAAATKAADGAYAAGSRAKFQATERTGKTFNGLKPNQIITDPNHLQALDDFQTSMRDGVPPPVKDQQRIVNALHEVKQSNGLDFLSGSPDARAQRIEQYQQQWHEGIGRYQNKLVNQQAKPSVLADENGGLNNRGASNANQLKQQLGQVSKAMKAAQGTPRWDALAKKADTLSSQLEEARFNQASAQAEAAPVLYHGGGGVNGPLQLVSRGDFITDQPFLSLSDKANIAKKFVPESGGKLQAYKGHKLNIIDASDVKLIPNEHGGMDIDFSSSKLAPKDQALVEAYLGGMDKMEGGRYTQTLIKNGYDGIKFPAQAMDGEIPEFAGGNEVRIINPTAIKKLQEVNPLTGNPKQPLPKPPSKRSILDNAALAAKSILKPLDDVGGGVIGDSPIRKALQGEKKQLVIENKLTKGGKAGRQNLSPEAQAGISGEHTVRNTKALQERAIAQADAQPLDTQIQAAHEALAVKPGQITDETVAQAQQAIERADSAGRLEDAVAIHDALSEHLVKNGQTIQAASLLYRLSPQGQFYKALKDLKKGGTTVTPEMQDTLKGLSDAIRQAPDAASKEHATAAFHKFVADNIPKSAANKALSVWKAGLLSGVKTQTGNALSNATFGALHTASNPLATALDKGFSLATGHRTKTLTGRGIASGTVQGTKTGLNTMKTGIDARNISGDKYDVHGELNFQNKLANTLVAKPTNWVFRGMSAGDQPFYYAAYNNTLNDLAKAEGINKGLRGTPLSNFVKQTVAEPPVAIDNQAREAARKAVLGQDNKLASAITGMTQKVPALQPLVPFVKVPTNFLARTIDFTPAGAIKEVVKQVRAGQFDQRAMSEALSEATTGTAVIYLGAELANNNLLSGQYPQNDPKEAQRWKTEKIQPNSVKIGGTWVSLNYLGPVGMLFGAGKDYHDAVARGDNGTAQAISGFGKNLTGQSFLTGFSGFSNALNDPQRSAKSFINSEVGSVVPSISNDVANFFDDKQRQANSPLDQAKTRLPGARNTLAVKQDVYGNELTQRTNKLNLLANPLRPSDARSNNVIGEVARLHNVDPNNNDLQVTPLPVKKTLRIDGNEVKLNDKQTYALQKQVGQTTQSKWGELIKTPEYQKLSDTDKANALNKVRQGATELAQREYVVKNNLGEYSKGASKAAQNVADSNFSKFAKAKGTKTTATDNYKSNDAEYKALQDRYKDLSSLPPSQRYTAQKKLARAKVGASYSKEVRDLYSMSKGDVTNYLKDNPNGAQLYAQLQAYDKALYDSGFSSSLKLKYGLATGKASSGGRRKSTGSKKVAKAKLPNFKATNSANLTATRSIANKVRTSTIKSSGSKKVAFSTKIKKTKSYTLNRRTA